MSAQQRKLWVITSFFNPAGYRRRLLNYRRFRAELQAPLVAVELSFDGRWELTEQDAETLVRVTDGDVMWQKERLLNLLVPQLPPECEYVAWLDADLLMQDPDWPRQAIDALATVSVVQLFSTVRHLSGSGNVVPSAASTALSAARAVLNGRPPSIVVGTMNTYAHGNGLAARRDLLEHHGLYDSCIIGGGDSAFLGAAYGVHDVIAECWQMSPAQRDHYSRWAAGFHADVRGQVGALVGEIHHLWHGDLKDRRYSLRHGDLVAHRFDPLLDLRPGLDGPWCWASNKPGLHSLLRGYFPSRHEDGGWSDALTQESANCERSVG